MLKGIYTHDEFIGLSQRKPDTEPYDSVYYYRLEMTELDDEPHCYPTFKVGQTHIIDFPTFDSAVYYMEKHSTQMNLYRSRITQFPLYENMALRGAQWLYDPDSKLVDCSVVQKIGTPEEIHFFGRPLEQQRFSPGNIAELLVDDKIRLVIVVARMLSPEECWDVYNTRRAEYDLDFASDSYTILKDDEGHVSFAVATALMKPRFPITPEMNASLENRYDAMLESAINGTSPTVRMVPIINEQDEE